MSPRSKTSKAFLILIAFSLTITAANAQQIEFPDGDNTIWLGEDDIEVNVTVSPGSDLKYKLSLYKSGEGHLETLDGDIQKQKAFSASDFPDKYGGFDLVLKGGGEIVANKTVYLRELRVEVDRDGSGFVNERLGVKGETNPAVIHLRLKGPDSVDLNRFISPTSLSDFNAEGLTGFDSITVKDGGTRFVDVKLQPKVTKNFQSTELEFTYSLNGSKVVKNIVLSPDIKELQAVPVGERPSPLSDFKNIKRNFSYNLNMIRYGKDVGVGLGNSDVESPLSNSAGTHNFNLDIVKLSKRGTDFSNEDGQRMLSVDDLSGESRGDYRVELSRIPDLKPGVYEFKTYLQYEDEKILIDKIRVNNGLVLSGQVMDSRSRGVEMNMVLNSQDGSKTIPVETDSSGYYEREIPNPGSEYDATMRFFDTVSSSRSYSDGRITVSGIDFSSGDNQNFAGDQQAIKFQYWQNPPVKLKAINPINMMAVKFGYPINSEGHTASMKFNPASVNTDELKVYRCSQWNFIGTECLGEWSEISGDLSINYQAWRANFDIEEPYLASNAKGGSQNILMNAYIVGTSADLLLNNGISVTGTDQGRVETGGDVKVSGRIVSENDNFVEGASVEVSFYEGSDKVASLDKVETDAEGRFSVKGSAPDAPGNYTVRLQASADNYNDLDTRFEDRFETFIAEGVSLKVDSPVEVTLGQETSTTVEVVNTGQTEMQGVQLSFSGLNSDFYTVSRKSFGSIAAGESVTAELTFNIPESYGVDDYPQMDVEVSAQNSEGEQFTASDSIQTQLSYGSGQTGSADSETEDTQQQSSSFSTDKVANMTGEFLESQSSLNIALGLILVFLMALAGAMKKKKEEGGEDRRRGGRPAVQKPSLQGTEDKPQNREDDGEDVDSQIDEIADAFNDEEGEEDEGLEEAVEETVEEDQDKELPEGRIDDSTGEEEVQEDSGSEDSEGSFECETCGETFDSESGRDLHQSVMHE